MTDAGLPALTLYRLGKLVTASLDLDTTLEAIVDAAHDLIRAESTAILLHEEGDQLVIRVGRGSIASAVGERVPIGAGVVGRALIEGRPVRVDDMLLETDRARPDLDERSGIRSYLAAPLVWRGDTLGVVTVASTRAGAFSEADSTLAGELAEQAAAAVAHARAYTEELARRQDVEKMNLALQRAQQRLIQVEKLRAIGQLANGLAHELNTPLAIIISNLSVLGGYVESLVALAQAGRTAAEQRHHGAAPATVAAARGAGAKAADLDYILEDWPALMAESLAGANRIAEIVKSVALFARSDTGSPAPVNVEEALQSAITLAWNELKDHARLERTYAGVPAVVGNASELTQVFVHLLLNAAQALPARGGVVSVSTAYASGGVTIRIADNGCGIPLDDLPHLFEPFFTTRRVGEGIGLGLSICHGIIVRHQGTIDVQSARGGGTTVTIRLNAAPA